MKRRHALALAAASLTAALPLATRAQGFPSKALRIVVPFAAGGVADITARTVAQRMSETLGQAVVIDNRPGAGGVVAAEIVAKAEPDGHTFFLASNTPMMQVPLLKKNPPYDPIKSFTPVTLVGRYIYVMVAGAQLPSQNAGELIQLARQQPGKFNYGSYSGVTQLMFTRLKQEAKLDLNLIPYKGESPTVNDILGGHLHMTFATPTSVLQHVQAGKLRAMAVLLPNRYNLMPQVPTAVEAGIPPLTAGTWAALFGPAKLPPEIAQRMSREMAAVMARPDIRERVDKLGFDLASTTPAELAAFIPEQLQAWSKAFADAGMQPE